MSISYQPVQEVKQTKSEKKAKVKPEPLLEVKPEPKQEPQPEPKLEPQPDQKPEVKLEPQPEAKPEPRPEVKPEPLPEVKPEPQQEVTPETQPVPDAEVASAPTVISQPVPLGPVFKVQIFAGSALIKAGDARFKGLSAIGYYQENGLYKYTVGESADFNEMNRLRRQISDKFPQAFVIAFKDGVRMDINEAIREFKKNR
jgi:N-acetylmuramoyl-L-alanine amidase